MTDSTHRTPSKAEQLQDAAVFLMHHRQQHTPTISHTAWLFLYHAAKHIEQQIAREIRPGRGPSNRAVIGRSNCPECHGIGVHYDDCSQAGPAAQPTEPQQ